MANITTLFDRSLLRKRRDRAADRFEQYDFLVVEAAERLLDRLDDIKRSFPLALDLGCHTGQIARLLGGRGGIEHVISMDLSHAMAARVPSAALVGDEEALPFGAASFDTVLSAQSLHWVNDLPGTLAQIRHILKPDGLFLGCFLGGETLKELRDSWMAAEMAVEGGIGPRISPFVDVKAAGALLQRAGFALPVVDSDILTVTYDDPLKMMADLRGMGESNALIEQRKTMTRRATMAAMCEAYRAKYSLPDGRIKATFQIVTLTAWAPHPSQPKPLAPGSGQIDLKQVL